MWMRRASRGRLEAPVSWMEVRGTDGFWAMAGPEEDEIAARAGAGCEEGEEVA